LVLTENIHKALKNVLHKMSNTFIIYATAITNSLMIWNTLLKKISLVAISGGIYICFHFKRVYNIVNNLH